MELFIQNSEFSLNSKVLDTLSGDKLIDLSKVLSLGNVTQSSIASLSNIKVLLL
jgi:hypothetical protein